MSVEKKTTNSKKKASPVKSREVFITFRGPIWEWIEKEMQRLGMERPQELLHQLVREKREESLRPQGG